MSNRAERRRAAKMAVKRAKLKPTLTPAQVEARDCVGDVWQFDNEGLRVTRKATGRVTFYGGV